jgi:diaminopimelate epimerase
MPIEFVKMHGLGNDYVYVDAARFPIPDAPALARRISDRHRGVGSDGLILVAPPLAADADVRMIMYNADGSRAEMCGNGVRCVAKFAYERGLTRRRTMRVETDAGVLELVLTVDASDRVQLVRVDMGEPILAPPRIPVSLPGQRAIRAALPLPGLTLEMTCVSMGNPHAVIFVADLDRAPLAEWGPQIERHSLFPQRVNAHFVQVLDRRRVRMATWERGAGPTQACGTGAAAVCVAGVLTGSADRRITATLPGGDLELEWDEATNHVFMTGPATEVFCGTFE